MNCLPSLNPHGLERQLLNVTEPLGSRLIKKTHHGFGFIIFFSVPDLMKTKLEKVGREEGGGEVEVDCLMETLSLNI